MVKNFSLEKRTALLLAVIMPGVMTLQTAHGQDKVQLTDAILHSSVTAPGINLGTINYYNDGQILKNMAGYINPGFEPALTQQIQVITKNGSTTSWTDPNQWNGPARNFWAGAVSYTHLTLPTILRV